MNIGIELLALRRKFLDAVVLLRLQQFAFGQFDAFEQSLDRRIGGGARVLRQGPQCAVHVVGYVEDIAGELGNAVGARVGDLALGALAQIFHLGQRAQQLVLVFEGFALGLGYRIGLLGEFRTRRRFGGRILGLGARVLSIT